MRFLRKLISGSDTSVTASSPGLVGLPRVEESVERTIADAAACMAVGRLGESIGLIERALETSPNSIPLQIARGHTLLAWGRHPEALDALKKVEEIGPKSSSFYHQMGLAAFWSLELKEAVRCMRLALANEPDNWERHFGLGMALHGARENEEAAECFERALEIKPDEKHCLANLVSCELDMGHLPRAEDLARRAAELYGSSAIAWSNLGVVLDRKCSFEDALEAFDRAEQLSQICAEEKADFLGHIICLLRAGQIKHALAVLEDKLALEPKVQAHCHYSLALLADGRWQEGWEQYEFRWLDGPLKESRPRFVKPAWIGQDLTNKTILLRSEQGFGDFFQFIRYAPYIKALGATVHLQLHDALREVARSAFGVDHILKADLPYPPFDFHVQLLSLPRIFGTEVDSVPDHVPYLKADALRLGKWKERFQKVSNLKVGLVWAGSPTHMRDAFRSVPFETLAPFRRLRGVTFYSLQRGPAAADARNSDAKVAVVDLESELRDFADTAAAIHELDLVICVDTAVAHLAGALGKPVWAMIGTPPDWRWLQEREDTPWYPSMRLYRQSRQGDWTDVIDRIKRGLEDVLAGVVKLPDYSAKPFAAAVKREPAAFDCPNPALTSVAYTRQGFLQYFPNETVGRSLRAYGEYLQPQVDLISRFIGPGNTVLEVGADIGVHAVAIAKALGPSGRLILYESRPRFETVLRQNLVANDIGNAVLMKRVPRGSVRQQGDHKPAAPDAHENSERIDELKLESLSLVKVGSHCDSLDLIGGATETFWRSRPYFFGCQERADECDLVATRMREFGYRTWRMQLPLFNSRNFNQSIHDIFSGQVTVAVFAVPEEIEMDVSLNDCLELT